MWDGIVRQPGDENEDEESNMDGDGGDSEDTEEDGREDTRSGKEEEPCPTSEWAL